MNRSYAAPVKSKRKVKKSKILDEKIWLGSPWIEPGPPEDTIPIRYSSLKIKTKNPGNFVTPTVDIFLLVCFLFVYVIRVEICILHLEKKFKFSQKIPQFFDNFSGHIRPRFIHAQKSKVGSKVD